MGNTPSFIYKQLWEMDQVRSGTLIEKIQRLPHITTLSLDGQNTLSNIHELTSWMKADCKKMKLEDFRFKNDPAYLRDISCKHQRP